MQNQTSSLWDYTSNLFLRPKFHQKAYLGHNLGTKKATYKTRVSCKWLKWLVGPQGLEPWTNRL
jgi:hypothetical protein